MAPFLAAVPEIVAAVSAATEVAADVGATAVVGTEAVEAAATATDTIADAVAAGEATESAAAVTETTEAGETTAVQVTREVTIKATGKVIKTTTKITGKALKQYLKDRSHHEAKMKAIDAILKNKTLQKGIVFAGGAVVEKYLGKDSKDKKDS
tara:strand:+ start:3653 stop:4111 length:459 start_codon:yes stop_codon:yes gene_type:complete